MNLSLRRRHAERWVAAVWGDRTGYFHFAFGFGGDFNANSKYMFARWQERSGRWPDDRDRFLEEALRRAPEEDVYVAPYLRSNPTRKKGNALPASVLYADIDELREESRGFERLLIDPGGLLVSSGEGLHVYVRLPTALAPAELESLNRHLAHRLHADSGWAENKVLRLPGTWNHKGRARGEDSRPVLIMDVQRAVKDWAPDELLELLGSPAPEPRGSVKRSRLLPEIVPEHILDKLHEQPGDDRSAQTFAFVAACLRSGLSEQTTLELGLQHEPTREKYGDRAAAEIFRVISKQPTTGRSWRFIGRGAW
jgi:RepB DNA-primase from phage plasmid